MFSFWRPTRSNQVCAHKSSRPVGGRGDAVATLFGDFPPPGSQNQNVDKSNNTDREPTLWLILVICQCFVRSVQDLHSHGNPEFTFGMAALAFHRRPATYSANCCSMRQRIGLLQRSWPRFPHASQPSCYKLAPSAGIWVKVLLPASQMTFKHQLLHPRGCTSLGRDPQ